MLAFQKRIICIKIIWKEFTETFLLLYTFLLQKAYKLVYKIVKESQEKKSINKNIIKKKSSKKVSKKNEVKKAILRTRDTTKYNL